MRYSKTALALSILAALWAVPAAAQDMRNVLFSAQQKGQEPKLPPPEHWQGVTNKVPSKARYFLHTGFTFAARLQNKIWSFNTEAPVILVVDEEIVYLNRGVIPAQTRIIGTALVGKSHDRVLVNFTHLIFPTGDEVRFSGMALALDGSVGIPGKVETHKDSAVANTVLRSVVTGTQVALDVAGASPIASQAAQGISQEALKELDLQKQEVTTSISVDADTGIRVYVNQRLEY